MKRLQGRRWKLAASLLLLAPSLALADEVPLPDNPLAGRLLFENKQCGACHDLAGSPRQSTGPRLQQVHFRGTFLDLGAALWNHVPGMSVAFADRRLPWPRLSAEETVRLTSFLYFLDYLGRPGDPAAGRRLYADKGCAHCHGVLGRGGKAPELAALTRFASPLYAASAIWNHGPRMLESMHQQGMAPPRFDAGDLSDLSAFLRQLGHDGPQEQALLAPGNPNRGREHFTAKGCALCHGESRSRGHVAPDLKLSDLHHSAEAIAGTMWNHAGPMNATMRASGVSWPTFTTAELADLVAFIYFLPFDDPVGDPARGARVFNDRSCVLCHGDAERAAKGAPDLSAAAATESPAELVAAMWNHAPLMRDAILSEGLPWPELTGGDLRDLRAFLKKTAVQASPGPARGMNKDH